MDSRVMCPHPKIGPARPKTVVCDRSGSPPLLGGLQALPRHAIYSTSGDNLD